MSSDTNNNPKLPVNFELLASTAPALVWHTDEIGHGTWFSQDWQKFRGTPSEQDAVEGWHQAIVAEDLSKFLFVFRGAHHTRNPYETVCRFKRHDGGERWMKISGAPLFLENNFRGFVSTCFDITDSKLAYDKIQQNEVRLRRLLDEALVGFAEVDAQEIFRYANPAFCKMVGYNQMEILGRTVSSFVLPEDLDGLKTKIKQMLDSKAKAVEHQLRFFHKKGDIIHGLLKISPIRNGSGIILGFNTQAIDISEMILLEQNLQRSKYRLQLALRTGKMGVWDWDLQHNQLHWDESHFYLYGLASNQRPICGLNDWAQVIYEKDRPQLERQIENILEGVNSKVYTYRVQKDDQNFRYISSSGILERDEHGNPLRITGLSWDVTESRNKEKDLNLYSAQSSIASRIEAFAELAKFISHEIELPFRRLSEFTTLARQAVTSNYDKDAESFVAETLDFLKALEVETGNVLKIIKESERLAEVPPSNSIVDYSVEKLLNDSIGFVEPRMIRNNIRLEKKLDSNISKISVRCVPRQLVHILLSVLSESISQISSLNSRWIKIELNQLEKFAQIKIINSDIILPSKTEGIGLQVINTLLNHSGGSISFDPAAENTTYIVEVPLTKSTAAALSSRKRSA